MALCHEPMLEQLVPVDDLGPDEAALQVGVDHAGALGRLGAGAERPRPALLVARREERAQPEEVVGGAHHPGQRALAEPEALEHLGPLGVVELGRLGLELHAHAEHLGVPGELGGDGGLQLGDALELVLADVDDGQHRLVGEEELRAQRARGRRRRARPGRAARPRPARRGRPSRAATSSASDRSARAAFWRSLEALSTVSRSASASSSSTIRRCSSGSSGPGTSSSTNARSTNTMASTSRMPPRNRLPRPSPLLAPSTSPPMSTTCTAACTTFFDLRHRRQGVEAVVGHLGDADVGVLGGEGVGRGERAAASEGVEERRLPGVGEADEAEAFHRRARLRARRRRRAPPYDQRVWSGSVA